MPGLLLLGFATGFFWGREYGYQQGKSATIRAIEQKVNDHEQSTLPT